MWFADIYCDAAWVSDRKGVLGPKCFGLCGAKSESLGIEIEFHFFGDEEMVRHIRILMHTDDQRIAETCLNLNVHAWVTSLEVSIMMETKQPFQIMRLPGPQTFAVALGQGPDDSPAVFWDINFAKAPKLSYERIAYGLAAWNASLNHHLFYFRRFVDGSFPLDVRWLNGYRLLEWHFVAEKAGLSRDSQWREFVARFDAEFRPLLRPKQTSVGLLEEARALAAHAGIDNRSPVERARDQRNAMEKTFRVLELMVTTVLNEHPALAGGVISFETIQSGT